MPAKKSSRKTAKKKTAAKRPAAKKSSARKRTAKRRAAPVAAPAGPVTGERLTEVARTIGSTMGEIIAKTKRVLEGEPEK